MPALQIRDVPDRIRELLAQEAEARHQSLQGYLMDVLEREARGIGNRRLVRDYSASRAVRAGDLSAADLIRAGREERNERILAAVRTGREAT